MPDDIDEEIAHLTNLISILLRRKRVLETQRALFGPLIPPRIVLELEDIAKELGKLQADLRRRYPHPTSDHNPYKGLETFQEQNSAYFFGRDALVDELLVKVPSTSFLAVMGASGSGKSSLVRAGLLSALKQGQLPGSKDWYYETFTPGENPLDRLAMRLAALYAEASAKIESPKDAASVLAHKLEAVRELTDGERKLAGELAASPLALLRAADDILKNRIGSRLVLVIDQAEELWTLAPSDPTQRTQWVRKQQRPFIELLLHAVAMGQPILVVVAMRADFFNRLLEYPGLVKQVELHLVGVSPMQPDDLRAAIEQPAALTGGAFEPGLADELIEQTLGHEGTLPLLEYTLKKLWERRTPDEVLTWEAFNDLGGIVGTLAKEADDILKKYYPTTEQQTWLRGTMLRLVQPGENAIYTRRRVPLGDLSPSNDPTEAHALLKPLIDARLLTTSTTIDELGRHRGETIEVTHEALIRSWPLLTRWIEEAGEDLRFQHRLAEAAQEWYDSGKKSGLLWSGLHLINARAKAAQGRFQLNSQEQAFLDASLAARRRMWLSWSIAAIIVVVLIGATLTQLYRVRRANQFDRARTLIQRGKELYDTRPLLALRLELEGLTIAPQDDSQVIKSLITDSVWSVFQKGRILKLDESVETISPSDDGTVFVIGRQDEPGELVSSIDGHIIQRLSDIVPRSSVYFSPKDKFLVVGYSTHPSELRRVDDQYVISLAGNIPISPYHNAVFFSPDENYVLISYEDKANELRDIGEKNTAISYLESTFKIDHAIFSHNSIFVAIFYTNGKVELRNTKTGRIFSIGDDIDNVYFSNDARFVAFHHFASGLSYLYYLENGYIGDEIDLRGEIDQAYFSPNIPTTHLAIKYRDGNGELIRLDNNFTVSSKFNEISSFNFSPNSNFLLVKRESGYHSEMVNFSGQKLYDFTDEIERVDYSKDRDENYFVVTYKSRRLHSKLFNTKRSDFQIELAEWSVPVQFSISSSISDTIFIANYFNKDDEVRRASDGKLLQKLIPWIPEDGGVIFSPDHKTNVFVIRHASYQSELWIVQDQQQYLLSTLGIDADSYFFSKDGKHLVFLDYERRVYLIDVMWLYRIGAKINDGSISLSDFVRITCDGPLTSNLWTSTDTEDIRQELKDESATLLQRC